MRRVFSLFAIALLSIGALAAAPDPPADSPHAFANDMSDAVMSSQIHAPLLSYTLSGASAPVLEITLSEPALREQDTPEVVSKGPGSTQLLHAALSTDRPPGAHRSALRRSS